MGSKVLSDVCYLAQVAPSGECSWGESLVRLIAAACGSFFAYANLAIVLGLRAGTGCTVLRGSLL